MNNLVHTTIIVILSMILTMILTTTTIHTLGEDSYLKPKLIEMQCAIYDKVTGDFILENQLNTKGIK